jgi:hypothetical protein
MDAAAQTNVLRVASPADGVSGGVSGAHGAGAPTCAFRVMRLRAASYEHRGAHGVDDVGLCARDFARDARESAGARERAQGAASTSGDEGDALVWGRARASSGELALPQSFGAVSLGETFTSFVTFGNFSSHANAVVREVGIKVELQSERQRVTLYDGSKTPGAQLRPGEKMDLIVTKDLKELGAHTLVCSATYYDDKGERKYLPQYFKFKVANPLNVRTKVRLAPRGRALLEVCIENATRSALLLEQARFDAVDGMQSRAMTPECGGHAVRFLGVEDADADAGLPSLGSRAVYQLEPSTGAAHYLFEITRDANSANAHDAFDPKTPLGKLELRWRGNMGDPGRLQTQIIVAGSAGTTDPRPTAAKIIQRVLVHPKPVDDADVSTVYVEKPFVLRVTVEGLAGNDDGVDASRAYVLRVKDVASGVFIDGPRSYAIGTIARGVTRDVDISCVALGSGVQQCPSLALVGALDDALEHAPPPLHIFAIRARASTASADDAAATPPSLAARSVA